MQNSIMLFTFFLLEWKYPFWANLVQKSKILILSWNSEPTLIRTCRVQWWCSFVLFFIENTPFGQIWSKNQNYQLKLKFGTWTNSNMQNSMMQFTLFDFEWKNRFWVNLVQKVKIISWSWNFVPALIQKGRIQWCCSLFYFSVELRFLGKFGPKNQNSHFKLKFGTYTNSNMQSSMVMFIYFVFDWKYPFWANLVQKSKIISSSWNLVPGLIRICRIQWCCSRFLFLSGKNAFG